MKQEHKQEQPDMQSFTEMVRECRAYNRESIAKQIREWKKDAASIAKQVREWEAEDEERITQAVKRWRAEDQKLLAMVSKVEVLHCQDCGEELKGYRERGTWSFSPFR